MRLDAINPTQGPPSGETLFELRGDGFGVKGDPAELRVGDYTAQVWIMSPTLAMGMSPPGMATDIDKALDVTLSVNGQQATLSKAWTYTPGALLPPSPVTRVVRAFIASLRQNVLQNTVLTTHTDFEKGEVFQEIEVAKLPALVLVGPSLPINRWYSSNEIQGTVIEGVSFERAGTTAVDVVFEVIGIGESTPELLNLSVRLIAHFEGRPYLAVPTMRKFEVTWDWSSHHGMASSQGIGNIRQFSGKCSILGVPLTDDGFTLREVAGPVDTVETGGFVQFWPNEVRP